MEMVIRDMAYGDWADVGRIYQAGMDTNISTFQTDCPPYVEWDGSHMKKCRLVAVADDQVIGWTALTPVSSRCVYAGVAEVSIYIDANNQGMGVGERLLGELIRQSEENDIWTLQSGIMEENAASIRLHEKCGFRMVGYREKIGRDRFGTWRNNVLMEKRSRSDRFEGSCPDKNMGAGKGDA